MPKVTWPIAPMKAATARLPRGDDWVYEPKWDGHRAVVRVHAGRVDVASSTGKERQTSWPWLAEIADDHLLLRAVLDLDP